MYRLRILVNDRPIPVYHDNKGQLWVESRDKTTFKIKVENNDYNRVSAVVSVDGLNVIDAKHEDPMESTGYIINGNSSITIPGWKISQKEVREFYFTSKEEESYSSKIGADKSNRGIIGVAIISEKPAWTYTVTSAPYTPWNTFPYYPPGVRGIGTGDNLDYGSSTTIYSSIADPLSGTIETNSMSDSSMSVGSGAKQEFVTKTVDFEKKAIETIITIRYDSREGLINRGIITDGPKAFPITSPYCPDV